MLLFRPQTTVVGPGDAGSNSLLYPLGLNVYAMYPAGQSALVDTGLNVDQQVIYGITVDPGVVIGITTVG